MSTLFAFSTFPTLTTRRLRLRQLRPDDAEAVIALYSSAEVLRYLSDPPLHTHEKAIGFLEKLAKDYENHIGIDWAITLQGDDRLIGIGEIYNWVRSDRRADLGYQIMPAYWGQGYATEVTRAMLRWGFVQLNLHRFQADITDGNIASERVLLKCGFKIEGLWRESCWEHARFVNIKQFGLLRREYDLG